MSCMKTLIVVSMISLLFAGGCALMSASTYERWVTIENGSDVELYAKAGYRNHIRDYGLVGDKGARPSEIMLIACVDDFILKWKEGSIYNPEKTTTVDLKKFRSKIAQVKHFTFTYLGNGRWQVKAYSGVSDKSAEVKPD